MPAATFRSPPRHQAVASAANSSALGKNANAGHAGSTAVGFAAATTRDNQVVLGGAGSSVTVGDIAASTAAQSGTVNIATVDASGTLGASGLTLADLPAPGQLSALSGQVGALSTQVGDLFDLADVNRRGVRKAHEGVALALAMESPVLMPGANFGLAGGFGYYKDRVAGAVSFAARVSDTTAFTAGVGVGADSGEVGARAGFQMSW